MRTHPTDAEILALLRAAGGHLMPTYVIKNQLRRHYKAVETPWVLRRMKALESYRLVKRVPSSYATMICWEAEPLPKGADHG